MFTNITQLHYQGEQSGEHIWLPSDNTTGYLIAGRMLGSEIVRVRFLHTAQLDQSRYEMVDKEAGTLPYHSWIVAKGDEQWPDIQTTQDIQTIFEPYIQGFAYSDNELRLTRSLSSAECIYGLGERTGAMNKRGQAFPIWNIDPPLHHNTETLTMYTSIPFYVSFTIDESRASGVLIDHTGLIEMDFGKANETEATMTVQGDSLVAYFFFGPTAAATMRQYSELTGRMPLPARWTLGHHQCRWGYTSQQEVLDIAKQYRERHHPCDALWLDIDYMQGYRNFTWNPETFPNPAHMSQQLHEQGFRLVTIVDPGTKIDEQYDVYQEMMKNKYYCHYPNGEVFKGSVWPGMCVFPDYSRNAVRTWWGSLYQRLVNTGVDGIWNDMNEPSLTNFFTKDENEDPLHGKTMDENVLHEAGGDKPTSPDGPPVLHKYFHNAYGMEMARSSYEGLLRLNPNARPFVLTRSGTAGMQRYAALWTGDNTSEWEHILMGIRMCLNVGMSGVPFVGTDIGGFWDDSNGELLVRFAQMGALLPFCRNHSALNTQHQEPWAFGEPYEDAYRKAIEARYRLMPYLYTLFQEAAATGAPIMRPLYYHYPNDRQAVEVDDAFLIGESLLSAPVLEAGATTRDVYLPEGTWLDYWDGSEYPGGATFTIPAPLDGWPLLVRGDSILPSGPIMQHIDEQAADPLTFTCYMTTNGLASYTLYEDDGSTQNYRNGAFARTSISCRAEDERITVRIDEHHQNYQPQRENYEVVVYVGNRVLQQQAKAGQGTIVLHF